MVPGDLPKTLVKNFAKILCGPITTIFKNISKNAGYPKMLKIEH